jgi:hypothetical protein
MLIVYSGMVVFILGSVLRAPLVIPLVGFAVGFVSMFYAQFRIRCPRCNANLGSVIINTGGPFALSKKTKFCPSCGVDFDTETELMNKA